MVSTKKTQNYSLTLTLLLWLTATLIVFFAPMQETEKIRTMQVSLSLSQEASPASSSTQTTEQNTQSQQATEATETAEVPEPVEVSAPAVERVQPTQPPQPRPQPVQSQSPPSPLPSAPASAPQVLAPDLTSIDIGGSVAQSTSTNSGTRQVEWPDESEWVTQTSERTTSSRTAQTPTQQASHSSAAPLSQFEGTAAQSAQVADSGASAVSDSRESQSSANSASSQTASTLGRIEGRISQSTFTQTSSTSSGISYKTDVQAAEDSQSSGVAMQMRDGTTRRLLEPKEPSIVLSVQSEALIDSSKRLLIQFTVLASGNISPSSVSFSPSGLIPLAVQEEIRSQIAQWRFESASGNGQAAFQYSINKE